MLSVGGNSPVAKQSKKFGGKLDVIHNFEFRGGAKCSDSVNRMGRKMDPDGLIAKGVCEDAERDRVAD